MPYKKPEKRTEREAKAFQHWLAHPTEYVKDVFNVTPDDWQGDALNGIFTSQDRCAFKAAHGVGKTTLFAWAGWLFLNAYEGSRLVATAPTFSQLNDVLFPEYAKWHGKMTERMRDEWQISGKHIRYKGDPYNWFGVARTSNHAANLQGFHNSNIMIQGDEASAIPEEVFEVIEGTLSEAGEEGKVAKLLIGGNPNFNSGELYNAFNKNKELYHCVSVTGDPKLLDELVVKQGEHHRLHGRIYYSPRVKATYINNMTKKYGEDSAIFDVRVRGIFPRAADDAIFPFEWVQRAMTLDIPKFDQHADAVTLVVDVARGSGAESVIGYFRKGLSTRTDAKRAPQKTTTITFNMVKEAVQNVKDDGLRLQTVLVDEPGMGGPVIDALRRDGVGVTAYNGGVGMKAGIDPAEDCRMFLNTRARDHWHVRRLLEQGRLPLPNDEVLLAQMTSLKYGYVGEKIKVEAKEDLKDRLGKDASPDRSDVIVMGTAPQYSAAAVHGALTNGDIILGSPRPRPLDTGDFYDGDREFC